MSAEKKTVLITGVGKGGIGYGVAKAFLKAGWQVAVTGRGMDKLGRTAEELKRQAEKADFESSFVAIVKEGWL